MFVYETQLTLLAIVEAIKNTETNKKVKQKGDTTTNKQSKRNLTQHLLRSNSARTIVACYLNCRGRGSTPDIELDVPPAWWGGEVETDVTMINFIVKSCLRRHVA